MISTAATLLFLASAVYADVEPTTPSGTDVYNEGSQCNIAWNGDASGLWSGMAIQLMTGPNFPMVPVTTVATDQDGNTDGTFSYTCPDVDTNSQIYFYQFTAPGAVNTTWTTRFTLAAADGSTTDPENALEPDGSAVPWGTGALVDQSAVVAPPAFSPATASGSAGVTASTGALDAATTSGAASGSGSDAVTETSIASTTRVRSTTASHSATKSGSAAESSSTGNSAAGLKSSGWMVAVAAAIAFVL